MFLSFPYQNLRNQKHLPYAKEDAAAKDALITLDDKYPDVLKEDISKSLYI